MENKELELDENVVIVDVNFLNAFTKSIRSVFEEKLQRQFDKIKVNELLDYILLDMELVPGDNACTVIWVYDSNSSVLSDCTPSNIQAELTGMGFDDKLAKYSLFSSSTKGLISIYDLAVNVLNLTLGSQKVKRIGLVIDTNNELSKLDSVLSEVGDKLADKKVTLFDVYNDKKDYIFAKQTLLFPIMQAYHIKADELGLD